MAAKVLLCSPYKGAVGGIQRWTNHIMNFYLNNVNHNDFEIDFFCLSRKIPLVQGKSFFNRVVSGVLEYAILIKNFRKSISKINYNIIHITSSASISLLKDFAMLIIAKRKGVKTVIHFRFGRIPDLYRKKNWEYKLLNRVVKLADVIIVIDKQSYNVLINQGYKNIELLPNPLSPDIQQILNKNLNITRIKRKILFAGHVVESKGIFELIEACRYLDDLEVKFIGPITKSTKIKIDEILGIDHTWLTIAGEQDYETTIKEMLSSSIFVLPSYTEGFPNVILESMACGCSIIASNVGAIPEMLNVKVAKNHGICVEPKDIGQLKTAISKMLDNPKFAEECGINAKQRVNELYSMPIVWSQLNNLWKSLIIN